MKFLKYQFVYCNKKRNLGNDLEALLKLGTVPFQRGRQWSRFPLDTVDCLFLFGVLLFFRHDRYEDHWRYDPRFTGSFDDEAEPHRDPYGDEFDRRSVHSEHSAHSLRSSHSVHSHRSSFSSRSQQVSFKWSHQVFSYSYAGPFSGMDEKLEIGKYFSF